MEIVTLLADKENGPKTINEVKLINAGKILENNKTLAESRSPVSELPGGAITMLVVVRPPFSDKNSGNYRQKIMLYINRLYLHINHKWSVYQQRIYVSNSMF